jgi:membrane protease YdiL (CAAX protease family)
MQVIARVADRRPLVFVLLALLVWFLVAAAIVAVVALLLRAPIAEVWPQTIGSLAATGVLLLLVSRLGWLRPMGITTFGTWTTWALTLLLGAYLVLSGFYAFFGEVAFDARTLFDIQEARSILLRQAVVGFVEETVFRGIILYALVRVWGRTKPRLLAAVIVQAALFAVPHMLQALVGLSPLTALVNVASTFVSGLWLGLLVLSVGTLWPGIVLHAVSNAAILIQGLSSPWIEPSALGYIRATLFELLLVVIGLWIILKARGVPSASPARTSSGATERSHG